MKPIRTITSLIAAASVAAVLHAAPAPRPSSFYGRVTVAGEAAPEGTRVSGWLAGAERVATTTFLVDGDSVFRLDLPGDVAETAAVEGGVNGQTVEFRVEGAVAPETGLWFDGSYVPLDLSASPGADLGVTVDDGVGSASPGDVLSYTLVVSNTGSVDATGVLVRTMVPAGCSLVSASDGGLLAGGEVEWPVFDLAAGASVTRTVSFEVGTSFPAGTTELVSVATVASDGADGLDPDPSNNTVNDTDALIGGGPDLVVEKTADLATAQPGDQVVYTLTVRNDGYQDALGVTLTDTLPAGVLFQTASDDGGESAGVVSWPPVTLTVGESLSRTMRVLLDEAAGPTGPQLVNTAAAASSNGPDLDPADNQAVHTLPVTEQADLSVVSVDPAALVIDPQTLGASGTVEVVVTNHGNTAVFTPFEISVFEDVDADGLWTPGVDTVVGSVLYDAGIGVDEIAPAEVPVAGTVTFRNAPLYAFVDSADAVAELDEDDNLSRVFEACEAAPSPGAFDPVVELSWPTEDTAEPYSADVLSTPLLAQLTDDNGDGVRDERDVPDLVFVSIDLSFPLNPAQRLRAIRGDTGETIWDQLPPASNFLAFTLTGMAVGDIDLDGRPEIIVPVFDVRGPTGKPNRLAAYEHNGALKWISNAYSTHPDGDSLTNRDNPSLADLDRDGLPEIIVGGNVFNRNGTLLWHGAGGQGYQSADNRDSYDSGAISIAADLDLDGDLEVVTGNTAYRSDGSIYWQVPMDDGYAAVGNFDADDYPEIVVVARGSVRLHEHDGTLIWGPAALPGTGDEAGGAPTVANFDDDPEPEIGVAGSTMYTVFETDGSIKWQSATQDGSSNMTGSTVFDLDGDGRFEVIYRDETSLRIYRGADGFVLYQLPLSSTTLNEEPVVADVDRDGNAEIIVSSDLAEIVSVPQRTRGIRVIGDANDRWVAARPAWNQHAYHIDNVAEDGFTITRDEAPGWLDHGTYRANVAPAAGAFAAPDLSASRIVVDVSGYPTLTASVRIGNGGSTYVPAGLPVAFYDGDPAAGGALLGVETVSSELLPGHFAEVSFEWTAAGLGNAELFVVADDDGTAGWPTSGTQSECDEANNVHGIVYDTEDVGLFLTLTDGVESVRPGESVTYTLAVSNANAFTRTGVALRDTLPAYLVFTGSADGGVEGGGVVTWPTFDLAAGATIVRSFTAEIDPAIPVAVQTLTNAAAVDDDGAAGPDPTPANNLAEDTDRVLTVRADAGGPYTGDEGTPITFDGSASSDRDGTVVAWAWDFDGDGAFDDGSGASADFAFDEDGTYTIRLRVTDDSGEQDFASAEVVVSNLAPVVDAGPDQVLTEGDAATLLATVFTDAGALDTHTATVDWGDGTVGSGVVDDVSNTVAAGHDYPDDGVFPVEVCVTDDEGATGCDTLTITVENAVPVVVEEGDVDLHGWQVGQYPVQFDSPDWRVSADGTSVNQARNGDASIFYGGISPVGTQIEGRIRVGTNTDDDFIGFVLGYRPGDETNPAADFLLIDWKKAPQTFNYGGCFGNVSMGRGLAISRVHGVPLPATFSGHFGTPCLGGSITELARGATLGDRGWSSFVDYTFRFEVSTDRVRVFVDGTLEVDIPWTFTGGQLGFYNNSQQQVIYSAFSVQGLGGLEGEELALRSTFGDVGVLDTHTATIDWRDGTMEPGVLNEDAGSGEVVGSHAYQDDGVFEVQVCVEDDDGGVGCGSVSATVVNVAPVVNAGEDRLALIDGAYELSVPFTDPGQLDTHAAIIRWGDGTVDEVELPLGARTVAADHAFPGPGTYEVEVCVTDDDGGSDCDDFELSWLEPVLDLAVGKRADWPGTRGGEDLTFTLEVRNAGTLTASGIEVVDQLPEEVTFVSASDGGVFDPATGQVRWQLPELGYRELKDLSITVSVPAGLPVGSVIVNGATATDSGSAGADSDPTNNSATAEVLVVDLETPISDAGVDRRDLIEGERLVLSSARFRDTDPSETHTATIDWGDGVVEAASVNESGGVGTIAASHIYLDDGSYAAELCVTDSGGHVGCDSIRVEVANSPPRVIDPESVDLFTWTDETHPKIAFFVHEDPDWRVAPDGQSVTQFGNSPQTYLISDFPAFGSAVDVTIEVRGSDDDFIGFALGIEPGDTTNPNADYLLLDWKKVTQNGGRRGLAVSRVFGVPTGYEFWEHNNTGDLSGGVEELARGLRFGDVGWQTGVAYHFSFELTPERLRVFVDGELEIDITGTFSNGRFAYSNNSQDNVVYTSFRLNDFRGFEGMPIGARASFLDPGILDTHQATFVWGDGSPNEAGTTEQSMGSGFVSGLHAFAENGTYEIEACVTDDDGAIDCGTFVAVIENSPPVVDAGPDTTANAGGTFALPAATFADPGTLDTHTATVDWGDGAVEAAGVDEVAGAGAVLAGHVYAVPGEYTVEVCVTDDEGDGACDSLLVTVLEAQVEATLGDVTVTEGVDAEAVLTVSLSRAPVTDVSLSYATVEGSATEAADYTATSGVLTIAAGETSGTIAVPILDDGLLEETETFRVVLSDPTDLTLLDTEAEVAILDDEPCPSPELLTNPGAEADAVLPLGWTPIAGDDWQATLLADGSHALGAPATESAELAQSVDVSAFAAVIDDGGQEFSFAGYVSSADEAILDAGRLLVEYRDADGSVLDAFDSGPVAATSWTEVSDQRTAPAGTRRIRVRLLAEQLSAEGDDVLFDDLSLVALRVPVLEVADAVASEGDGTLIHRLLLSCPIDHDLPLVASTADGTALEGEDYLALIAESLTLPAGETLAELSVPLVDDAVSEGAEHLFAEVGTEPGAGLVILDGEGIGVILDDDVAAGCVDGALGLAGDFNVFVFGDLTQNATDCEGRLAAGGRVQLQSYGVGQALPASGGTDDRLVAGGDLVYTDGTVWGGNVVHGGTAQLTRVDLPDGTARQETTIDFEGERARLEALSSTLAAADVNGTTDVAPWGAITLTGSDPELNVFSLAGSALGSSTGLTVDVPAGATALVNVDGSAVTMQNFSFFLEGGADRQRILLNLHQATSLTVQGIAVEASILAPRAAVQFNNGALDGSLVAASLQGSGESHHHPFASCLPGGGSGGGDPLPDFAVTDGLPSRPALSIGDVEALEGDSGSSDAPVGLSLDRPSHAAVSAALVAADGSATEGLDYAQPASEVSLAAGEREAGTVVPVLGDTEVEGDEGFRLLLDVPSGGVLGDALGLATILD
ncbi:MAG: choice-of-anchor A family protein, partial [Acidobacteria bacterium]|nr:choice-of-anchor A family protein [Acidobacteriota bacterium]